MIFFKQKSNVIFRNYKSFGYITDNRNFGYKSTNNDTRVVGDKILSESGAIFFSVLKRTPQTIDKLVKKIITSFENVDIELVKNDANEFYSMLEKEGFVTSGATYHECEEKDIQFSYKHNIARNSNVNTSFLAQSTRDTQDFLKEYFKGEPQLTNIHVEITSKCNERCIHCYIPNDNKTKIMDSRLFYNILEQCNRMNLLHLTLSGGEPMSHRNFCDFLKKCRKYNFSINVLSNLTLLSDEIIREMKKNPLLGVQVSLYSMNPNIHDEITQKKGSFEKTKSSILKLIENDIPLQISCPIMKQNKNCYGDVIEWSKKMNMHVGADYTIIGSYNHTTQNLDCRLSIDEIQEITRNRVESDTEYIEQIKVTAKEKINNTLNDPVCSVCRFSICVAENGNVYPCAGWQDYILGNVRETSLNDIWNNSEKIKYLRNIQNKDFPHCIQCADKDFCTICMVRNANENSFGDPFKANQHFCDIARLHKQIVLEWDRMC